MKRHLIPKFKHREGCFAVAAVDAGRWKSPWFMTLGVEHLAADGTKRGTNCTFHVFCCNDPGCPASVLVSGEWLEEMVFAGVNS